MRTKNPFGIDGRLLRTLRDLTLRPGDAIRAWVHGRRQSLVAPVRYYLGAVVTYVLVASVTGMPGMKEVTDVPPGILGDALPAYLEFFSTHLKLITVAFLPAMAVFLHAAFRSQGYDLAESFAFTLFSSGHVTLLGILGPLGLLVSRAPAWSMTLTAATLLISVSYLTWAARRFYGDTLAWTALKVVAVYAAWTGFLAVTMGGVLAVAIALS